MRNWADPGWASDRSDEQLTCQALIGKEALGEEEAMRPAWVADAASGLVSAQHGRIPRRAATDPVRVTRLPE